MKLKDGEKVPNTFNSPVVGKTLAWGIVKIMWFKKLQMKFRKRAFANTVLLQCNRLLYDLLENDNNNEGRQEIQETIKNHCFDIIRKKGSQEINDFRKKLIETVLRIVQSDNPIISMRKELIHVIHCDTLNRTFFLEKFKDRRQKLYEAFNTSEIVNCDETSSVLLIWSEAQCVILRMLQLQHFEEVSKDDWFSAYCEAYEMYTERLFELLLSKKEEKEIDPLDGVLFRTMKQQIEAFQQKLIGEVIGDFSEKRPPEEPQTMTTNEPSAKETAEDPVHFTKWIAEYAILKPTFEEDMKLAPSEDICKRNNISDKERILCANEFVLMRTLGACVFVRKTLDEAYYLKFRETLLPLVEERMKRHAPYMHNVDVSWALNQYMEDMKSDSPNSFSLTYLDRVYPDTDKGDAIFIVGIPVHCGFLYATNFFEHTRDGYCLLKTGMRYEALKKIQECIDIDKSAGESQPFEPGDKSKQK